MKQKLSSVEINMGYLLALGFTKKEIAFKKNTSESTIRHQEESLYLKTQSKNITDVNRFMHTQCLNINLINISRKLSKHFLVISTICLSQWLASISNAFDLVRATLIPKINPVS